MKAHLVVLLALVPMSVAIPTIASASTPSETARLFDLRAEALATCVDTLQMRAYSQRAPATQFVRWFEPGDQIVFPGTPNDVAGILTRGLARDMRGLISTCDRLDRDARGADGPNLRFDADAAWDLWVDADHLFAALERFVHVR